MTALQVKTLIQTCGRCGGQVVGDNMGTGRPWQHIDGPDDHPVIFGTPAPALGSRATLDDLEAVLLEEPDPWPEPGTPEPAADELFGNNRNGRRQILNLAEKQGFTVEALLCTGPVTVGHASSGNWALVDSLAVGFTHPDGRRAVACWERKGEDWEYLFALCSGTVGGLKSSPELRTYLKSAR